MGSQEQRSITILNSNPGRDALNPQAFFVQSFILFCQSPLNRVSCCMATHCCQLPSCNLLSASFSHGEHTETLHKHMTSIEVPTFLDSMASGKDSFARSLNVGANLPLASRTMIESCEQGKLQVLTPFKATPSPA
eukprot:4627065-Amphidinium_carterae.1